METNMIWRNFKGFFGFVLAALSVSVFGSGLLSQNASAVSHNATNIYYSRAYRAQSSTENNFFPNQVVGTINTPYTLFTASSGVTRTWQGATWTFDTVGTSASNAYNTVSNVEVKLRSNGNNAYFSTTNLIRMSIAFYETGYTNFLGSSICTVQAQSISSATFTCPDARISTSDYKTIGRVEIILGELTNPTDQYIGQTASYGSNSLILDSITYDSESSSDPTIGLLNEQIEQQQRANDIAQETQDYITDDTPPDVDTDNLPSVGLLPAGPLDSLLGLPITLMTSISTSLGGQCSPISIPLPYVNDTLAIPCFDSIFYSGNFAPLANVIGVSAAAVILYYWLKHLYKKVDRATSLQTNDEDEWGVL